MSSGPADARALSQLRIFDLVEIAYGNPFVESRLEGLDVEFDVRFGDDVLRIIDASVSSPRVEPGADVNVRVHLRRYDDTDLYRTVRVHVPERAAGQSVQLQLRGGSAVRRQQPIARNLQDLIERASERFDAQSLVATLRLDSRGLRFRGHVVDSLPRSALNSLQFTTSEGPGRAFVTEVHQPFPAREVTVGSASLTLQVEQSPEEHRR